MNHGVGIEYGSRSWLGGGGQRGKNWDNCNRTTINYFLKKKLHSKLKVACSFLKILFIFRGGKEGEVRGQNTGPTDWGPTD